ncbi:MAG: glycosyltransferase family 9 protein [Flavobacteriia bacterium]
MPEFRNILISRTDAIGDVCLTLPACQAIKSAFPDSELTYLCSAYTKAVVSCFEPISDILTLEQLEQAPEAERNTQLSKFDVVIHLFPNRMVAQWCKQANIPMRIGTAHRFFHLWTCNFRPRFTRKRSELHEAQLNFKLLAPLSITEVPSFEELNANLPFRVPILSAALANQDWSQAVLLHPKSNGSGVEYPIEKYVALSKYLVEIGYQVYFTGTEKEGACFRAQIPVHSNISDATGKWDLQTFIYIISQAKALVACSTGPYHLAGLCGIRAVGLFASRRPIHPGRWAALGNKSVALEHDPKCAQCSAGQECACIAQIKIEQIIDAIEK